MALRLLVTSLALALARASDTGLDDVQPRRPQPRIVGGTALADATSRWPYYVLVQSRQPGGTVSCGGTLISPTAVLTAAHCVKGTAGGAVFLGMRNATNYGQAVVFTAGNAVAHPRYSVGFNDIAVVRLSTPARAVYPPARLEPGTRDVAGASGIAMGYGYTKALGLKDTAQRSGFPTQLLAARLPVVNPMLCEQRWGALFDRRQHICAGSWTSQVITVTP